MARKRSKALGTAQSMTPAMPIADVLDASAFGIEDIVTTPSSIPKPTLQMPFASGAAPTLQLSSFGDVSAKVHDDNVLANQMADGREAAAKSRWAANQADGDVVSGLRKTYAQIDSDNEVRVAEDAERDAGRRSAWSRIEANDKANKSSGFGSFVRQEDAADTADEKLAESKKLDNGKVRYTNISTPEAEFERINGERKYPAPPATPETEWMNINRTAPPSAPSLESPPQPTATGEPLPAPPKQNTTFFQGGAGQDIDQAIAQAAEENRKRAPQASNNQAAGAPTGQSGTAQPASGTPAANTSSSEPSAYAKAIKEENDRYTKETAGFDEKRKSLLRADGDQTEALKGLETERAVAARQHGINRIQNAMDAMQGTEAFGKLYETEHLQSSGITKTGFLTSGMHYASFTEEERNGFLKSASKELGLTAEETKELKTASSSISQAYKNIWKQQAEIKSRYGESMKLVNSKDGLANMTTEQKIKHLGLTDKQVENLRKGLPMSRTGSVADRARGFLSSTFSNVKDFFHGRMNMSNTTSSTYGQLQEARRERQLGQALDNMIIQRAKTGEWTSKQTADRLAAIKRGDAAAIYDAAHAYDGPNANKTGALLREAPAAKAAAKKAAAETGGRSGIKWKGKVSAAAALLGLGAVFGTMMGHHGEQSNAQLYNPNPQPQYAN